MEGRITDGLKLELEGMEKRMNNNVAEVLDVVQGVAENTASIIEKLDNNLKNTERTVGEHDRRLDKAEDSIRVIKTKLAI